MQKGDDVERLLGPQDKTPGKVLNLQAGMVPGVVLLTTKISSAGDAGSPVVDSKGRIVAIGNDWVSVNALFASPIL